MIKLIIIIIILTFFMALSAEENLRHGLGFTGGMISGSGFSYRQMNENYGFQFAIGAITLGDMDDVEMESSMPGEVWTDTTQTHTETIEDEGIFYHTNLGASYYKFLHKGEKSVFYALIGAALYTNFGTITEQDYVYTYNENTGMWDSAIGTATENEEITLRTNFGIGIGIDYKLTENIHINLDWPFVYSRCEDDFDLIMYIPQAGIHYYFK